VATTSTTTTPATSESTEQADGPATGPVTGAGDIVTVIAWRDPVVENVPGAMRTDSDDALVWYTPFVGTIGMVMAHRFAHHAADGLSTWTIGEIAGTFGVGPRPSRVLRTVDRLDRFGIARRHGATVAVRLWLPPLTHPQRRRLPGYLAAAYNARRPTSEITGHP
jgi:hypothetical protein